MPQKEEVPKGYSAVSHFASYSVFAVVFGGEEENLDDKVKAQ